MITSYMLIIIENLAQKPIFYYPALYCHQSVYMWKKSGWSLTEFNTIIFWRKYLLFLSCWPLYLLIRKRNKSTANFSQTIVSLAVCKLCAQGFLISQAFFSQIISHKDFLFEVSTGEVECFSTKKKNFKKTKRMNK